MAKTKGRGAAEETPARGPEVVETPAAPAPRRSTRRRQGIDADGQKKRDGDAAAHAEAAAPERQHVGRVAGQEVCYVICAFTAPVKVTQAHACRLCMASDFRSQALFLGHLPCAATSSAPRPGGTHGFEAERCDTFA